MDPGHTHKHTRLREPSQSSFMVLLLSQKDTEDSVSTALFETAVLKIVLPAQFRSRGDLASASQATSKLMKRHESLPSSL